MMLTWNCCPKAQMGYRILLAFASLFWRKRLGCYLKVVERGSRLRKDLLATGRTDALFITLILLWIVKVHALKACTHELFSSHAVSEQFIAVMEQFNRPDMNLILFSSGDRLFRQKVCKLEIIQKLYKCHPSQTYQCLTLYTRLLPQAKVMSKAF